MRLGNDLFARAVNWLIDNGKVRDQQQLAEVTKITETTISRILNDRVKQPSKETIRKLLDAFPGIFNPAYFRGESIWMTMQDLLESQEDEKEKTGSVTPVTPPVNVPDMSSVFNAALAAKDETIVSLKRELSTKDDLIQSLRDQLAAKDQLIAEQKARLIDYRRIIDSHDSLDRYPFPIGAADGDNKQKRAQK